VFTSHKPYLGMCLSLAGLLFVQTSLAEPSMVSKAPIYRPTTNCQLIQYISTANANPGSQVDLGGLVFELTETCDAQAVACGFSPTICYANDAHYAHGPTGLPEITGQVTILSGRIIRAVGAPAFRFFTVTTADDNTPGNLFLFKVTLENGDAEPAAAGVETIDAPVEIELPAPENSDAPADVLPPSAEKNRAFLIGDSGNGGAVYVDTNSSLGMEASKIGFNFAYDSGGGVYVAVVAVLEATNSIFSHNTAGANNMANLKAGGGGIYLAGSLSTLAFLINSTVSNNTTPGLGGGLNNQGFVQNIFDSTFSYNSTCVSVPGSGECGPGANPTGAGGGIYNDVNATALIITQSTFWGNRSYLGGAIYNEEATVLPPIPPEPATGVLMNNNTIANNFSQMNGGGIYNQPATSAIINQFVSNLVASNTDFDGNQAPDIYNVAPASITAPPLGPNPVTPIITEGFNLVGDCGTAHQCGLTNDVNKDIVGGSANVGANIDPRLHRLKKNGGPTETVALYPDSPAVNNGFNNLSLQYDQRGPDFFRTVGQTDIGAYEYQYD